MALVTGATRGIGSALAGGLREAGHQVIGVGSAEVDVTSPDQVDGWVADVVAAHGVPELVINNAGLIDDEVPIEESDPQQWWRTLEVNVRGPYLVTRAVLPHLLLAGRGRVVNINSGAAVRPATLASAYRASKTALTRITGATHLSGQDRGVTAFDLMPGVVRTDMTSSMDSHADRTEWTDPSEVIEMVVAIASGTLDAWSGRMIRVGADTPASLREAADGLTETSRSVVLEPYGDTDPYP